MKTTLADVLKRRRAAGRVGFVPFLVAGDPSFAATVKAAKAVADAGADILEVGVPFSDPVADGPVIQAAGQRALAKGMSLRRAAASVSAMRRAGVAAPAVLFTYLNPVLRLGEAGFGLALLQQRGIAEELARGDLALIRVGDLDLRVPVARVVRRSAFLSRATRALLAALEG